MNSEWFLRASFLFAGIGMGLLLGSALAEAAEPSDVFDNPPFSRGMWMVTIKCAPGQEAMISMLADGWAPVEERTTSTGSMIQYWERGDERVRILVRADKWVCILGRDQVVGDPA